MGVLAIFYGGIDLMPFHLILGKDTIIREYGKIDHLERVKFCWLSAISVICDIILLIEFICILLIVLIKLNQKKKWNVHISRIWLGRTNF